MLDDEVNFDRLSPRRHIRLIVSVSRGTKQAVCMKESKYLIS